ncbi:zinc finger protein 26-like [Armigeres subalbatus]|uniref:zinc finger protein 26-like n=1 Tax=Armigeres subalbatus TaxID=124917 RepID=UPI002ED1C9EC
MSLLKNPVCPFEKQEVVCKICEGIDGAMESIFCEQNDHRLLNKIFKSTNVKVEPVCGILSPICEFCRTRIDQFDDDFKPHCKEYVVEKVVSTAPDDDPFNSLDPCQIDQDEEEKYRSEKKQLKNEPFVKQVPLPLKFDDEKDEQINVPESLVDAMVESFDNSDGLLIEMESDRENDPEIQDEAKGEEDSSTKVMKKRGRGRPRSRFSSEGMKQAVKCEICGKLVMYMKDHMRMHEKDKKFKCPHCDRSFSQSNNLIYHIRKHTGEKPFPCDKCDKSFICKSHLLSHARSHENDKPFQCEFCSKRFNQACNLTKHLRVHSGEKPYSCKQCGKAFMNLSNMKVHAKRHSGDQNYTCEICSKSFYDNYHLVRHMMVHSKKKHLKCVRCSKQFNSIDELKSHSTQHKGPEEIICCEICSKPFNTIFKLNLHMRVHEPADKDSLKCKVCLMEFERQDQLELHRVRVHGEPKQRPKVSREIIIDPETANKQLQGPFQKPYQCDVCFKLFNQSYSLKVHLKTHISDDKLHTCDKCPRMFRRRDHLEAHQRRGECIERTESKPVEAPENTSIDLSPEAILDTQQIVFKYEIQNALDDKIGGSFRLLNRYNLWSLTSEQEATRTSANRRRSFLEKTRTQVQQKYCEGFGTPHGHHQAAPPSAPVDFLTEQVKPVCGILSPICEFCRTRIDQFDDDFKPHCKEYVVEKVVSTAPDDDPFNSLDPCQIDQDEQEKYRSEKKQLKNEPFVKQVPLPLKFDDEKDEQINVPESLVDAMVESFDNSDGLLIEMESDRENDPEMQDEAKGEEDSSAKVMKKRGRGRPRSRFSSEGMKQAVKCEICGKLVMYMKDHMRMHEKDKKFKCPHCDRSFSQSNNLIYHIRKHTGEKPFPCDKCDKSFICKSHLLSHARSHENDKPFQCEFCSKRFNQACNLTKHLRVHSGEKPYSCKQCGKAFMNLSNMKVHAKRHSGDQNYTCEICSKSFYDNYHLVRHMMVHSKKKHLKCVRCSKQFNSIDELKSHSTQHKGPEEIICCEICSKPFNTIFKLNLHMRVHEPADKDSLKCKVCLMEFERQDQLELHRVRVHGEPKQRPKVSREIIIDPETANKQLQGPFQKPYQCDVCFKLFNQSYSLKVHLKTHISDDKLHTCDKCPRMFRRRDHLEAHQRRGECIERTESKPVEAPENTTIDLSPVAVLDTQQIVFKYEIQNA